MTFIVHYQLPHSSETYVHRSGRTARAKAIGTAIMLVGPSDRKSYFNIIKDLQKSEKIKNYDVNPLWMREVRKRVDLAVKIHIVARKLTKSLNNDRTEKRVGDALELNESDSEDEKRRKQFDDEEEDEEMIKAKTQINNLKTQLDKCLQVPVTASLAGTQQLKTADGSEAPVVILKERFRNITKENVQGYFVQNKKKTPKLGKHKQKKMKYLK